MRGGVCRGYPTPTQSIPISHMIIETFSTGHFIANCKPQTGVCSLALQSQDCWVSNFTHAFDLRVKRAIFSSLTFFVTIIARFLRRNYVDGMALLLYDDSSSSSDSSDEDMLDEIFVDALFPNHKQDYLRVNIEDLSENQCEAMFR